MSCTEFVLLQFLSCSVWLYCAKNCLDIIFNVHSSLHWKNFFMSGTNSPQKKIIEVPRVDRRSFQTKRVHKKVNKIKATLILKLVRGRSQTTLTSFWLFLNTVSTLSNLTFFNYLLTY